MAGLIAQNSLNVQNATVNLHTASTSRALQKDVSFLLDEPSANLDFPAIRELRRILSLLKAKGKTILVAEHRTWYLGGIADGSSRRTTSGSEA